MTTPTTGYMCKNASGVYQDLSGIFQGGNSGVTTGFKIPSGQDLGSIFSANSGSSINFATNFIARNGQDLKLIFAPIQFTPMQSTITGFTETMSSPFQSDTNYYAGLSGSGATYYNSGNLYIFQQVGNIATASGSITIPYNATVKYYLVSGGGGGGANNDNQVVPAGLGGCGGNFLLGSITVSSGSTLNLTVGGGGRGFNGGNKGTSGNDTILNSVTVNGGIYAKNTNLSLFKGNKFTDSSGNTYYYGGGGGSYLTGGNGYNSIGGSSALPSNGGGGGGGGGIIINSLLR
jgi:hypothetical protein